MKKLSQVIVLGFVFAVSGSAFSEDAKTHGEHKSHAHKQGGKDCTHKATKHGDHTDYEDEGHHHKAHGDHFDECHGPEGDVAKPAAKKKS